MIWRRVGAAQADFQASLSRFQQSFLDGQTDIRQYSVLLDPVLKLMTCEDSSVA